MNVPKHVRSSRSLFVVAKQLLPYRFDVYGHAYTGDVIPDDWLNSFAFQPISNLASSIRLAFDGRIELAFGCELSVGPAFRITWVLLLGNIGLGIRHRLTRAT